MVGSSTSSNIISAYFFAVNDWSCRSTKIKRKCTLHVSNLLLVFLFLSPQKHIPRQHYTGRFPAFNDNLLRQNEAEEGVHNSDSARRSGSEHNRPREHEPGPGSQ